MYYTMDNIQVCYSVRVDFWICSSCWNIIPWLCHHHWSGHYGTSSIHTVVVDDSKSIGDCWGAQWVPLSLESFKLSSSIWRVSLAPFVCGCGKCVCCTISWYLFGCFNRAEFHDFHHRVLYTKSGNYASTFTYMDWWGSNSHLRLGWFKNHSVR